MYYWRRGGGYSTANSQHNDQSGLQGDLPGVCVLGMGGEDEDNRVWVLGTVMGDAEYVEQRWTKQSMVLFLFFSHEAATGTEKKTVEGDKMIDSLECGRLGRKEQRREGEGPFVFS